MQLKHKIPLILFAAFVAIISITFTVSLTGSARVSENAMYETGQSLATAEAEIIKGFFDMKLAELAVLEKSLIAIKNLGDNTKRDFLVSLLESYALRPTVSNAYIFFESGTFFSPALTEEGHYYNFDAFVPMGSREVVMDIVESDDDLADDDDWFHVPKDTRRVHITEPYEWAYTSENIDRKMLSLSAPLIIGDVFLGVTGIDIELSQLRDKIFKDFESMDNKRNFDFVLVSNEGLIALHKDDDMLLEEIGTDLDYDTRKNLLAAISEGEYFTVRHIDDETGRQYLTTYVPMVPDGIELPWSFGLTVPVSEMQAEFISTRNTTIILGVACAVLWGVFLLVFTSAIFGSVTRTVTTLGLMAEGDGDLTIRLEEKGKDEFGMMARKLNDLLDKLHNSIKTTQSNAENLSAAALSLHDTSQRLTESSENISKSADEAAHESGSANRNVDSIAAETERISASITELSATAQEMGTNMDQVVQAVEKMNQSFNTIAVNARDSKNITDNAITRVSEAKKAMDMLGASAGEIGNFINVIQTIAKKTNLIAINATVEAARAGEVGKGFAVVANEVKQLAEQSASNADDITHVIENMRKMTSDSIEVIGEVVNIMNEVCTLAASISEHIEDQLEVSGNLADSTKQTNSGTQQVVATIGQMADSINNAAQNAAKTASSVQIVAESVGVINDNAIKNNQNAMELKSAADKLQEVSGKLGAIVSRFRT